MFSYLLTALVKSKTNYFTQVLRQARDSVEFSLAYVQNVIRQLSLSFRERLRNSYTIYKHRFTKTNDIEENYIRGGKITSTEFVENVFCHRIH